jgi:Sulfotransferase family
VARRRPLPVRIFNGASNLLGALGRRPAPFAGAEATLREAASQATGLDDFGEERDFQGLRVLLDAYEHEARLNPFGRMMVRQELAGILKNRLRVREAWKRDPALLDAPVRRPLFILGLPRTGTTALHFLLAEDPANQVLEYWLAAAPGPRPPRAEWKSDPRYKEALRGLKIMYYLDPDLKAIHLMTADGPDECRHLFLQSFLDHTFDSNATIPSYTKWFEARDMRQAYERHRDVLKLIQAPTPERRWVLKYPAHMRNLRVLLEVYPDACIVQTHRDPRRVLPSICSLVAGWRGLYEDGVDRRAIGPWQLGMYAGMMETAMQVRTGADPARFYDLSFDEMVGDPVAAIGRLYDHFGFELSAAAERRMRAWHAENPQGKHGGHQYRAEEFGLRPEEIAERFSAYCARFAVRSES